MKVFSGSANKPLAEDIAKHLGVTVSPLEIFIFPDGERRIQVQVHVVDEECLVVQPTATPADQNYFELFFIIDALKRSGAKKVTAVVPYLGYQRQDHVFRDGEAVSLEVIVKTLEATGLDDIIVFDLHTIKIPEVFSIPVTHLSGLPLFAEIIKQKNWHTPESVLVTPDLGGIRRIKILSGILDGMPFASIEKDRNVATGHIEVGNFQGEIKKRGIIVDDMISSGNTIVKGAQLLRDEGAEEVHVFVTHGVFSQEAPKILMNPAVTSVYVTDSVFVPKEKQFEKLTILPLAKSITEALAS